MRLRLEVGQDHARALEDRRRNPRQSRHVDAVALVRGARHDLVQEDDLVAPLAHGDVVVLQPRVELGQLGQFVVVRGEERARFADWSWMYSATAQAMLTPSKVLVPRPTSSRMIRLSRGGVVEDVRGLDHLDHEGALAAREVVGGADAGEDAVHHADRARAPPARSRPSAP